MTIRPVLQRPRPHAVSRAFWLRCQRCDCLTYGEEIGIECDRCVAAARKVWPWASAIDGGMSGA